MTYNVFRGTLNPTHFTSPGLGVGNCAYVSRGIDAPAYNEPDQLQNAAVHENI